MVLGTPTGIRRPRRWVCPQRGGRHARPGKFRKVARFLTAAFRKSSNPGIRRPRWGGVAVGVAVSATPSRTKLGANRMSELTPVTELTGIGVTDASLCGY